MPHEERKIVFNYEESYRAIYSMCQQKGMDKPPVGSLNFLEVSYDNPFELRVVFEDHKTNLEHPMMLSRDFVIAALMIMCRNIGIPLPKGANKTLELEPDGVVLRVQLIR